VKCSLFGGKSLSYRSYCSMLKGEIIVVNPVPMDVLPENDIVVVG
jgi:hypothetical protein